LVFVRTEAVRVLVCVQNKHEIREKIIEKLVWLLGKPRKTWRTQIKWKVAVGRNWTKSVQDGVGGWFLGIHFWVFAL